MNISYQYFGEPNLHVQKNFVRLTLHFVWQLRSLVLDIFLGLQRTFLTFPHLCDCEINSIFSAVISLVAWRGKFDMLLDFHVNFSFIYDNDD